MIRWVFDVMRLSVALAVNTLRLRRAEGLRSTSTECIDKQRRDILGPWERQE